MMSRSWTISAAVFLRSLALVVMSVSIGESPPLPPFAGSSIDSHALVCSSVVVTYHIDGLVVHLILDSQRVCIKIEDLRFLLVL